MCKALSAVVTGALLYAGTAAAAPPAGLQLPPKMHGPSWREVALPVVAQDSEGAARAALGDPADLFLTSIRSSLTMEHVRFGQLAPDHTPVLDAQVAVHLTGSGPDYTARVITSNLSRPLTMSGGRSVPLLAIETAALRVAGHAASRRVVESKPYALSNGGSTVRAGWRVLVATEEPYHTYEIWVDGDTATAAIRRDLMVRVDGSGMVYKPNPVTTSGNVGLRDNSDADSTTLTSLRESVPLRDLDGTGILKGLYVDARRSGSRATELSPFVFDYPRSDDRFEEVSAYFHVDRAQRNLQTLGFVGGKAILNTPFRVTVNAFTDDNSFYDSSSTSIQMGSGGVDDAEDGDVVVHEYGHAVQDNINPGYGTTDEASAIGEGFGDLLATLTPTQGTVTVTRACVAPWDATAYSGTNPPCLRRTDDTFRHYPEGLHGESHDDGELWTGALWNTLGAIGLRSDTDGNDALQLVVEANFLFANGVSMEDSAHALIMANRTLHGGAQEAELVRLFTWRGLLMDFATPDAFTGTITAFPVDLRSDSPLPNDTDENRTITIDGATAIRVHFASLNLEVDNQCMDNHCDAVYVYDGAGQVYARYGGNMGAFDSVAVPGDTIIVRWISDGSVTSPGFVLDRVDVTGMVDTDGGFILPDAAPAPDAALPGTPDAAPPGTPDAGTIGDDDKGCGCHAGGTSRGGAAWTVLALAAVAYVVRRRR